MEGNSHKEREKEKEEFKVKPVVKSEDVEIVKQNGIKKSARNFLAEDMGNVKEYIIRDIFIPTLKDTIVDIVQNGIEMLVKGDTYGGGRRRRRSDRYDRENYNRQYRDYDREYDREERVNRRSDRINEEDFKFRTKAAAKDVLEGMYEILELYPESGVSIANLYDLADKTCPNNVLAGAWGWFDLDGARIIRCYDGRWLLDLPRAKYLR